MKTKNLRAVLLAVAACALTASAFAINVNGPGVPKDPGPQPRGPWVAQYKYLNPHTGPDGRYFTFTYVTITGSTQVYCEQQLNTAAQQMNVTVTQYCTSA